MKGADWSIVCVDQAHNAEKNHQVRSMGRIYASARDVHVWLGPAADEDALAVDELFEPDVWGPNKLEILQERHCRAFSVNLTPAFLSLEHFVSRSWFTRRWVLQEVYLGREVFVHCGERETSWKSLMANAFTLSGVYLRAKFNSVLHDRVDSLRGRVASIWVMQHLGFILKDRVSSTMDPANIFYTNLLHLLHEYDKTVCLDERDRLYSLYGLLTAGKLNEEQKMGLAEYCSVNYNVHFSHAYTVFASGAVEIGLFQDIITHTLQFGSLADQEENWPSWVPSWNLTRKMQLSIFSFNYLRPSQHLPETWGYNPLRKLSEPNIWFESSTRLVDMHGLKALQLRGVIHRVCHVRSSTVHSDAILYLEAIARAQHTMSSPVVAWVVALTMDVVPEMLFRPAFDYHSVCGTGDLDRWKDDKRQKLLFAATKRFMGLRLDDVSEEQPEVDRNKSASEAKRLLEGLESFCYEVEGSLTFGIAYTQVKPGDFVFRTPKAASGVAYHTDELSPSASGLIIRPYHPGSDAGPAAFRLVGMCVDWYPDVKDPEFVEVVLV
jgi:hypothetical protein